MPQKNKVFKKIEIVRILIIAVIVLLILLAGFLMCRYFVLGKENRYRIENKYYSLQLETPKDWKAYAKTIYSDDVIGQTVKECGADESSDNIYEVGVFKFGNQKFDPSSATGAILEIKINCIAGRLQYSYASQLPEADKIVSSIVFKDNGNK